METINIWTDGSFEKGHAVGGYVLKGLTPDTIKGTVDLGNSPTVTSNQSEFGAVVAALTELVNVSYELDVTPGHVTLHADSKIMVETCNDNWQCHNTTLAKLRQEIWDLCEMMPLTHIEFKWIPRTENKEADEVSRSLYVKGDACGCTDATQHLCPNGPFNHG